LPWACAGCRTPLESVEDTGFCGRCWLRIPRIDGLVCRHCGVPLKEGGNLCFSCREEPLKILVRAATDYSTPIPSAIHRFKYAGRKSLAGPFRVLMAAAWLRYPELGPIDAVLAVPLSPASLHERGYNQSILLAESLAEQLGVPILENALVRARKTRPQFQ